MVEGETLLFATVDAVDLEEEEARLGLGVMFEGPVRAYEVKLEAERTGGVVDGDLVGCGVKGGGVEVVFVSVCEDEWLFGDVEEVFLPGDGGPAVVAEKVVTVAWIVGLAELVVCFGEVRRREDLNVRLAAAVDGTGAPARVDEFPVSVVDADGVPGVA